MHNYEAITTEHLFYLQRTLAKKQQQQITEFLLRVKKKGDGMTHDQRYNA
jgi:hypothetical protein